jgi:hypothetical protein
MLYDMLCKKNHPPRLSLDGWFFLYNILQLT